MLTSPKNSFTTSSLLALRPRRTTSAQPRSVQSTPPSRPRKKEIATSSPALTTTLAAPHRRPVALHRPSRSCSTLLYGRLTRRGCTSSSATRQTTQRATRSVPAPAPKRLFPFFSASRPRGPLCSPPHRRAREWGVFVDSTIWVYKFGTCVSTWKKGVFWGSDDGAALSDVAGESTMRYVPHLSL